MQGKLTEIQRSNSVALYKVESLSSADGVDCYIASTPGSRQICNDPFVTGIRYTELLEDSCAATLQALSKAKAISLQEDETSVLHILRGGLNFGLREAIGKAFSWNNHASAYISAQRSRKAPQSEDWIITESDYKKIHLKKHNSIVFGDVVATGTSLEFALQRLIDAAKPGVAEVESLLFFTIGSPRSHEILAKITKELRRQFPKFKGSAVVYFEGVFLPASPQTKLSIQIDGTDLLRTNSILAPEFVQSQYESPAYPIERCTIYDAGSRAFDPDEYFHDVQDYWEKNLALAESGMTFDKLVAERFPELDGKKFGKVDLAELCRRQLAKVPSLENSIITGHAE